VTVDELTEKQVNLLSLGFTTRHPGHLWCMNGSTISLSRWRLMSI